MSYWTYVRGVIQVDGVGRTQPEIEYILKTVLDHLPLVTGSERNMHVYLNREVGYNESHSHNEFGEFLHYESFGLDVAYDDERKDRMQTKYLITIEGDFRDRYYEQTYKEFMHWLTVLAKRTLIDTCLVSLIGYTEDGEYKKTVINPINLHDLFEWPSWSSGKPAWWEYLRWEEPHDSEGNRYSGKPDFSDGRCLDLMTKEEREQWEKEHKARRK